LREKEREHEQGEREGEKEDKSELGAGQRERIFKQTPC